MGESRFAGRRNSQLIVSAVSRLKNMRSAGGKGAPEIIVSRPLPGYAELRSRIAKAPNPPRRLRSASRRPSLHGRLHVETDQRNMN